VTPSNQLRAQILVRAVEASVAGDVTSIEELFTQNVVGTSPVLDVSSREELAVELEEHEDAFTEIALMVEPLDVSGDRACVEWVASAVHTGALEGEERTIAPTGRRVTLRGVTVAEFEGSQIRAFRHYWDEAELLDGLGLLESP
jgi:ketosteroid isomerase-like protein